MSRRRLAGVAGLALLAGAASSAHAGSVLQPGGTIGLLAGVPLAEGIYFIDTSSYGERTATASGLEVNLTQIVWATPFSFYDTRLQFILLQPTAAITKTQNDAFFTNSTLAAAQLAHAFGNGFNASYQAGFRTAQPQPQAFQQNSFEQRGAVTYNAFGLDLTANAINGLFYGNTGTSAYSDWLNIDLTATKTFDKFEIGGVAFGSSDLSKPTPAYLKQRQIAVGGLVGYDFGRLKLQLFATRDVTEHHYTGYDTRGWARVIVPLYKAPVAPAPISARF